MPLKIAKIEIKKKSKSCDKEIQILQKVNSTVQWYLGFRPPPYSNNSVFDQKIRAKDVSKFEQNLGVRKLGLGTEKSRVESKRTPRSISRERKEQKRTRRTGFLLKRRGRLLPGQIHHQRERREKPLKESYPASIRSLMLFRYTFS